MRTKYKFIEEDDIEELEELEPPKEWKRWQVSLFVLSRDRYACDFWEKDGATREGALKWMADVQAKSPDEWVTIEHDAIRVSAIQCMTFQSLKDRRKEE